MAIVKREVLRTYRQILKLARSWEALNEEDTIAERLYIQEEARTLFRKNKEVSLCSTNFMKMPMLLNVKFMNCVAK